ncbi:MAG: peptidylprolyl isomerase [Synergistaceae bacterium]|nr:peptidylprolyl isomerase [Synergistaceae bacterium]
MRNKRRLSVAFFFLALLVLVFAAGLGASSVSDKIALAAPRIDDEDLITLLSLGLGGRDLAAAAWETMNPSEKQALRDQASLITSMAQAAEQDGLLASPDVELSIRWGRNTFLADAWEKKTVAEIDLSDTAVRAFYEDNLQRYADSGAVRYRQVTYPLNQRETAVNAKNRLRKSSKSSLAKLKECVTVNWIEYDALTPVLAGALRDAPLRKVMGPIEVPKGHMLYEVLERRKEGPTPFERCKGRVKNDLVQIAIKEKLEKLENLEKMP